MPDEIQPALSAEEWESVGNDLDSLLSHYGDGVDMLADIAAPRRSEIECRRVLMALSNKALVDAGHPQALTHDDLALLEHAAAALDEVARDGEESALGGRAKHLADRIAALLPASP